MELFINQEQYPAFVQEAGVRLQVHARHTLPKVEDYGHGIPPGSIAFIGVNKVWLTLGFFGADLDSVLIHFLKIFSARDMTNHIHKYW